MDEVITLFTEKFVPLGTTTRTIDLPEAHTTRTIDLQKTHITSISIGTPYKISPFNFVNIKGKIMSYIIQGITDFQKKLIDIFFIIALRKYKHNLSTFQYDLKSGGNKKFSNTIITLNDGDYKFIRILDIVNPTKCLLFKNESNNREIVVKIFHSKIVFPEWYDKMINFGCMIVYTILFNNSTMQIMQKADGSLDLSKNVPSWLNDDCIQKYDQYCDKMLLCLQQNNFYNTDWKLQKM